MFVLDGGTRVVVPRTELTYPGHNMKLHTNAASAENTCGSCNGRSRRCLSL